MASNRRGLRPPVHRWRRSGRDAVLIVLALSVLAMTTAAVLHRRLAGGPTDLGWVSERWLAEYRADASRPSR